MAVAVAAWVAVAVAAAVAVAVAVAVRMAAAVRMMAAQVPPAYSKGAGTLALVAAVLPPSTRGAQARCHRAASTADARR